jgi:peptide/bleomycin uptake transporter
MCCLAVFLGFFTKHWVFRWRHAMNDFYVTHWSSLRQIEGASQRVQEDTKRLLFIMESLGSNMIDCADDAGSFSADFVDAVEESH